MRRGSATAQLSIFKRFALARFKAGEWGREIHSVKGISSCLTFRLSSDPEESPSKTTQELYDLILLLYCKMYLQKHSWGQFNLRSCIQCNSMFIYIYIYMYIVLLLVLTTSFNYFVILHHRSYFVPSSAGCTQLICSLLLSLRLSFTL